MHWPEGALLAVSSLHVGAVVCETDALLRRDTAVNPWCSSVSFCLLILYICELTSRIHSDCKAHLKVSADLKICTSPSSVVDAVFIAMDVVNEVIALVIGEMPSRTLFLVLRILRLLRPMRTLAVAPALSSLLLCMSKAAHAAAWGMLFLVMLLSMWSIVAVDVLHPLNVSIAASGAYEDCQWCAKAFESVAESNLTFLRHIVVGDGWEDVLLVLIEKHPWTAGIFLAALVSIHVGLVSLVVASMVGRAQEACPTAAAQHVADDTGVDGEATSQFLLKLCDEFDSDGSGITIEKVVQGFESSAELRSFLRRLGVYRDDLQCMFAILDECAAGTVTHKVFAEQLLRMELRSTDSLLMFIRLNTAKAQQKFEEQLIWFEQRRQAPIAPKDTVLEKQIQPTWDSEAFMTGKKPVARPLTPFATMSECCSSGSLMNSREIGALALGEVGSPSSKLKGPLSLGLMPEQKMQPGTSSAMQRALPGTQSASVASELDRLRHQIDLRLDSLAREFVRNGVEAQKSPDDNLQACKSDMSLGPGSLTLHPQPLRLVPEPLRLSSDPALAGMLLGSVGQSGSTPRASGKPLSMPVPDLAVAPPPLEKLRSQARPSTGSGRRGSKDRQAPLPQLQEECPTSGDPRTWHWHQAAGISCCEAQRAPVKQRLVTVVPALSYPSSPH